MSGPVVFIIAVVLIAFGIFAAIQAKRRREAMRAWAEGHGLQFRRARDRSYDNRYPEFKSLRRGQNRYAHNIMEGALDGRSFEGFDYHYETHSTDSKGRRQTHHHHFSAVIVGSDLPLDALFIRPEGFFDKITEFFGMDDIDFESAEFSRQFYVKAADKRWAFDVLHARTIQFLLDQPRFTIQFDTHHVIAHTKRRFGIEDFEKADHVVRGILDSFPNYLTEQRRALMERREETAT